MVRFGWVIAVLVCGGISTAAHAEEDRIARQVQLLRSSDDFRVRTQAALALGASRERRAVAPLCEALADQNTTVRIASAAALGKLALGGEDCLKDRLRSESSSSVKSSIQRALSLLEAGGPAPAINSDTKYYLAIADTQDDTGHGQGRTLRSAMARAARSVRGYAVAPSGEGAQEARKVFAKHQQLKGFYLAPRLSAAHAGGNLTIRVSVAMFTYPAKALLGEYSVKLTAQGVGEGDQDQERELVKMAAERAFEKFQQNVHRL